MNILAKALSLVAGVAVASTVGCSSNVASSDDADDTSERDPSRRFSSEGLRVEEQTSDAVGGTFERDGAAVRFRFTRDGDARSLVLTTRDGAPLVTSRYEAGVDTSVYFGGRAKAVGQVDEEPRIEGERAAFDEIPRSDARVLPLLKEALIAAKVDRGLFAPGRADEPGGIRPQSYYFNGWYYLDGYDDSYSFFSWSFWGTTTVVMANGGTDLSFGAIDWSAVNGGEVRAYVKAGCCAGESIVSRGFTSISRQWWGAQITVFNKLPTIAGMTSCSTQWGQTGTQCTASASGTTCTPVFGPVTSCTTTPSRRQRLISYKY